MSEEKEIEELAQIIRDTFGVLTNMTVCRMCANKMVKAGYRKHTTQDVEWPSKITYYHSKQGYPQNCVEAANKMHDAFTKILKSKGLI